MIEGENMKRIIGLVLALLILPSLALADTFAVTTSVPTAGNIYASASSRPMTCQNTGTNAIYITLDGTVASTTNGNLLAQNGGWINIDSANAPVTAIASGGSSTLICNPGIRFTMGGAPSTTGAPSAATEGHVNADGAFGNNTNFPTGSVVFATKTLNAGHVMSLTCNNQTLNAGSCTTAPTVNFYDGASNIGTPLLCSNAAQGTRGTTTNSAQTQTFAAGDIIGLYISTQGGTCLAPTFSVDATLSYP